MAIGSDCPLLFNSPLHGVVVMAGVDLGARVRGVLAGARAKDQLRALVPCPSIFDQAEKHISLIVPAFNEEHRLSGAFVETINYLQKRASSDKSFSYEVIIVDDGSTDRTSKVAFSFVRKYKIENVRVILLGKNHGKGEAIRKGMLHSRGELLLMLDADGATKINDLEKLESQRKWYRNFLMKGFHLVVLLTAGPGIRDTQCGFKMFTRAAGRRLFTNMRLKRWCFDVELVYLCKHIGIPIIEVSVNWSEIPGSKVRLTSILHMLFELMLIRLGYGLGIWKIYT
ncbi:hypothetical protein ZIOFF_009087 [Zingiber officinale]|uniref:dolichyl-phosphate beta-glucosyltransferase n=1 Tax=Zingiber officinale TaxID=94328 RepID=A0A8J5LNL1_ZINOF|nr:hypothetical protein ZIOFF_009087 [Zingiber officinale]